MVNGLLLTSDEVMNEIKWSLSSFFPCLFPVVFGPNFIWLHNEKKNQYVDKQVLQAILVIWWLK